ncbi:HaeIII family restriction endonuclease [Phocaeicola salanitronis]|uniref:HaeIII family restriction endonuclease n=1 Tax=Phocaeicola salanitronis TaxID=376805 RepID=UPI0025A3F7E2|nr:HaeIII family restriction endonuclease [Phocaeicola salanitronis]MDM8305382.1 HaeIII family restriction endonuclease [Phocaeicola salanitronis]
MTKENAIQKKDNNKHDFLVMCKPIHLKIQSVFDYLNNCPNKLLDFNELPDKEKDIYSPLLKAFINEIKRQYAREKNLPKKLVKHLLGKYDFYKIVYIDKEQNTQIRSYNLHATFGTVNQAQEIAIIIPTASLPTRIIHLDFVPNNPNTIELYMNKGWQFLFRIHNTKTSIKPSLVFDIELIGIPITLTTSTCLGNKHLAL